MNFSPLTLDFVAIFQMTFFITAFADSPFKEHSPAFSPDDRWLAYVSDEAGIEQIYVKPFPGPGGRKLVSIDGGTDPVFNSNGWELFYRDGDRLMVIAVDTSGETFSVAGPPKELFKLQSWSRGTYDWFGRNYAVSADGQRFLLIQSLNDSSVSSINIVVNWFEELKERIPTP